MPHSPSSLNRQLHSLLLKTNLLSLPSAAAAADAGGGSSSTLHHYTSLISTLSRSSLPLLSLSLFRSLLLRSSPPISPDTVTLLSILSISARLLHLPFGQSTHLLFFKLGTPHSLKSHNSLINLYVKCGQMHDARKSLDEMPHPTVISYTIFLSGLAKFEGIDIARRVFDIMPERNEVSWIVMVVGLVEAGRPRDAFSMLERMVFGDGFCLSGVSVCSVLSACSQAGDLTTGRWVHGYVEKLGIFYEDEFVTVGLIDMYAKCGRIGSAKMVFERMRVRNLVAWNAMMSGLSIHGLGNEVLRLFDQMIDERFERPDHITFVSILSACSRSGLLEQGQRLFDEIESVYGLRLRIEHYACMVDLLGRAGKLNEAEALIRKMPMAPNEVVLGSLMASCSLHGKLDLGKRLMHELIELYPNNTEYHVLLSNLYSSHGKHAESNDLWREIKRNKTRKGPGISYIEVDANVHQFTAGDKSHPRTKEIYSKLDEIVQRLRLAGYFPNAASQISRVEDGFLENGDAREQREQALLLHSERLAVAFGLVSTKPGVSLRVFKNLRICSDCHLAMKLVSDIYKREIIIRDRNRFHCFKNGRCSCDDYW